ncbi:hypothetical protein CYMTET_41964 [Cymbomonas tetramitiformis]|uniref:Uncharacterized protein n=1 Tax=Cymbomonas tetramitiformis TaxID=36881 RepID=A0AAE0C6R2_9CHLO|nr:hypothetical protein CYMTET_41964 [Cymbomonas tetramitiformis]
MRRLYVDEKFRGDVADPLYAELLAWYPIQSGNWWQDMSGNERHLSEYRSSTYEVHNNDPSRTFTDLEEMRRTYVRTSPGGISQYYIQAANDRSFTVSYWSKVSLVDEAKEAKVLMSVPGERFVDEQRTVAPVMEPRKLSVVEAGTELWAYANPHATNPMQRMHDGIISTHTYVANFAVFMFNRTVHVEELMLAQNAAPTDTNRRITPPSNLTFYALNPEAPGPFSLDENDWMHVQTTVLRNGGKYDPADSLLETTTGDVWTMQRVLNSVPTIAIKVVFHEQMDTAAAWPRYLVRECSPRTVRACQS